MSDGCVFCRIISGELKSSVVAEDEHAVAIMDIAQINAGHVLVIPREHATELGDLGQEDALNVFRLVHRVACALPRCGIRCEGYHLAQANGVAAGQEIFHVHFHLVPRFTGDSVRSAVDPDRPKYDREELSHFAAKIAGAMR